jgi:uncharacterized protein YdeI (YjbR/CyaY-like superfamily)
MGKAKNSVKRSINPMSNEIRSLLIAKGLLEKYYARPPYQQNDYLGWISQAKMQLTKDKRIRQMLEELKRVIFT